MSAMPQGTAPVRSMRTAQGGAEQYERSERCGRMAQRGAAGDTDARVAAFRRIIQIETNLWNPPPHSLTDWTPWPAAAGGYARLQSARQTRQGLLQGQINSRRTQISLSYRNIALVLRDAGRIEEALAAAQQAAGYAGHNDLPAIEQLIADLQERQTP